MLAFLTDLPSHRQLISPALLTNGFFHYVEGISQGASLCDEKEISGVILDGVRDFASAATLCTALRTRYPEMPIAVLLDMGTPSDLLADRTIRAEGDALVKEVLTFCRTVTGRERQILSTRQLYITDVSDETCYLGYRLRLSSAEHRLLLCLTYLAPRVVAADELSRLCDPLGLHSAKSLAVRISSINQKAKAIHPRMLIRNVFKHGYTLNPEVL